MGVILALPFTYRMDVTASIVLLTAMYVSGTYGGRFHGDPLSNTRASRSTCRCCGTATRMARHGRPAKALGWTLGRRSGRRPHFLPPIMVGLTQPLARFRSQFLVAGVFRHPRVRFVERDRARVRVARQRLHKPRYRPAHRNSRHRPDFRQLSLHFRTSAAGRWDRVSRCDGRRLRRWRSAFPPRAGIRHEAAG